MHDASEVTICRRLFDEKFVEVEQLLADLPPEALLWRPFESSPWRGPAASLGWLIAHSLSSTIYLLRRAEWTLGRLEWSQVDGDEGKDEFGPANHDPDYLRERARRVQTQVHAFLDSIDANAMNQTRPHAKRVDVVLSVRYDVMHALEHLSQHIGHAQLTRQLWALL
ncbi:MAG: DinB family protein [Anaerolineales bacterium]|nr:DinB family protein [Anaerolineales bacterium]